MSEEKKKRKSKTPDSDGCWEKWQSLSIGERCWSLYRLAQVLEKQRNEARIIASGLNDLVNEGRLNRKAQKLLPAVKTWKDSLDEIS
jgi:hypothetical protein